MQQEGVVLTGFTYGCILKAYTGLFALCNGKLLHACVMRSRSLMDVHVSNALIDLYIKCGEFSHAYKVFNKQSQKGDLTAWNTMIAGFAQHDEADEAIQLFFQLYQRGLEPNRITFISIMKACSVCASLGQGRLVHTCILMTGMQSKISIVNALIDMYVKLGNVKDAQNVFDGSQERDVVTWSAMTLGYAEQSNYTLVLANFHKMQMEGIKPDAIAFSCLLSACRHLGEVREGYYYFNAMQQEYGIRPTMEHWNSLVDLLGGSGNLDEANNMLKGMPFQSNSIGWLSLLGHCKTHGAIELGRKSLCKIDVTDDEYVTGLVLLRNIHDNVGLWGDTNMIMEEMKCKNAFKKPGRAFIETANKVQMFMVGDKSHERNRDMLAKVKRLFVQVQHEGYMPCFGMMGK